MENTETNMNEQALSMQVADLKDLIADHNREHGRIHIENRDDIKSIYKIIQDILIQTTKTNGRVTNIETYIVEQHKINSKLNGMLEAQHVRLEEQEKRHSYSMGVLKAVGIIISIIALIGGYVFTLIVKDISKSSVEEAFKQNEAKLRSISRESVKEVLAEYEVNIE